MSLRAYLAVMGFATLLAATTFFIVLYRVDPSTTGALGFALFYLSLFLTLCGAVSIIGFLARVVMHREEVLSRLVGLSFRQAVLLSALASGALALHARSLLNWLTSVLLVVAITVIEFLFISLEKRPPNS